MSSTNSTKNCCSIAKNKIFEKNKMGPKWRTCCETTVAMATVLNKNLIFVMESKELIHSCLRAKA